MEKRSKGRGEEAQQKMVRPSTVDAFAQCFLSISAVSVDHRFLNIPLTNGGIMERNWKRFEVIGRVAVVKEIERKGQKGHKLTILLEIADIASNVWSALPIPSPLWVGFAVDVSRILVAFSADLRSNDGKTRQTFEVGADVLLGSIGAEIGAVFGAEICALIGASICTLFACPLGPVGALITSIFGAAIGSIVASTLAGMVGKKIIRRTMRRRGGQEEFEELGKEVTEDEEEEEAEEVMEEGGGGGGEKREENESRGRRVWGAMINSRMKKLKEILKKRFWLFNQSSKC